MLTFDVDSLVKGDTVKANYIKLNGDAGVYEGVVESVKPTLLTIKMGDKYQSLRRDRLVTLAVAL